MDTFLMKETSKRFISSPVTRVPYATINRFEDGFLERWLDSVTRMTMNTQFIGGEIVSKFEEKLALKAGAKFAVSCANGTDAIQLALRAANVGNGDIVLLPDLTFWATFEAVCNVGARPVTVDVDPEDFHLNEALVSEAIDTFKPKAVILVHLYGWLARDTQKIRNLCSKQGILLIEDAAQAWGCKLDDISIFSQAAVSTLSFYPGKVLGAAGDGGAVITNDEQLAERVRRLSNHGRLDKYRHSDIGWNSRLDTFQAEFLSISLDYISERIESRRKVCEWYRNELKGLPLRMRKPALNVYENGYISVATMPAEKRADFLTGLTAARVGYGIVYPGTISEQPGAQKSLAGRVGSDAASRVCQSVVNLPCFAYMQPEELQFVKSAVEKLLNT